MLHPRVLPSSRPFALAVRLLLAAALICGLLGMHVMMSPGAHATHGSPSTAITAPSAPPHDHRSEMHAPATAAEAASCASSSCADAPPASGAGVWAVVCVLALLLTALLVVRPLTSWRAPRGMPVRTDAGRLAIECGPRHPPSLIVLSISRT